MVYTEVSVYTYCTGDELEAYTSIDYSAISATRYSEALVMAKVTLAERMVNGYLGVTTGQTVTDGIKMATITIAAKLLRISTSYLGYHDETPELALVEMSIYSILRTFLGESSKKRDFALKTNVTDRFWYL